MVDGNQRERAESPEDEGVRQTRQRPLADDFPLQQDFPNEIADTAPTGWMVNSGSFFECRTVRQTLRNRSQNPYSEATRRTTNRTVSGRES